MNEPTYTEVMDEDFLCRIGAADPSMRFPFDKKAAAAMIDLHRILVPTDFSKYSQTALTYAGAFAENLALFEGLADRDRIVILLDMLGRKVCVSIEADRVAVA